MPTPLPRRLALGYGVAEVGASLSYNAINFFLLFFLVEVAGLRPGLAGAVLLVGRAFDALTDPLMGLLSDRVRARRGTRKVFVALGALPFGVTFALLWSLPTDGAQGTLFALAAAALLLHTLVYTFVQVPYLAMTPELAPDYESRTVLSGVRVVFATFASLIAAAAPPLLAAQLNLLRALPEGAAFGWRGMGGLFGALMCLAYGTMALSVREPTRRERVRAAPVLEGWGRSLRSLGKAHGYVPVLALFGMVTLGLGTLSSILPFFLASRLQLSASAQTGLLGLLFVAAALSVPLWTHLSSRLGKRGAFSVGLVSLAASLPLLVALSPPGAVSAALVLCTVLAGVGVGSVLLFPWAMLPDVLEFDALARGDGANRRDGLLYAGFTFVQKLAFALGAALNGAVLGAVGYTAGERVQTPLAVLGVSWTVGGTAALFFLLGLPLVWRYPISKRAHEAARARLAALQTTPEEP